MPKGLVGRTTRRTTGPWRFEESGFCWVKCRNSVAVKLFLLHFWGEGLAKASSKTFTRVLLSYPSFFLTLNILGIQPIGEQKCAGQILYSIHT